MEQSILFNSKHFTIVTNEAIVCRRLVNRIVCICNFEHSHLCILYLFIPDIRLVLAKKHVFPDISVVNGEVSVFPTIIAIVLHNYIVMVCFLKVRSQSIWNSNKSIPKSSRCRRQLWQVSVSM